MGSTADEEKFETRVPIETFVPYLMDVCNQLVGELYVYGHVNGFNRVLYGSV